MPAPDRPAGPDSSPTASRPDPAAPRAGGDIHRRSTPSAAGPATPRANRLAREASPYLLQHAHNPVDWFAWGPEAFAEARRRNVPIFLSIGYSTCYWCHVMERESFEDAPTGALMSERFVCIKVDREERPDVDDIYMNAVQLLTGHGGWPMSVWLTPPGARGETDRGLEPFYAGTYFPREPRHGMPAFTDVLRNISEAWRTQHAAVLEQAGRVTEAVREQLATRDQPAPVGAEQVGGAISALLRIFDPRDGGFGRAPKFPQPVFIEFLIDVIPSIEDPAIQAAAKHAVRHTLDRMSIGGIHDQVGGGFHRYSVDAHWLVPHFEKMLYDNAQLARAYARAYAAWGDEHDARIARRTIEYVAREMTDPTGAFWSAQDAEVNHREGQNYLWNREELSAVLGADDGAFAAELFGVARGPNFRDPHHPGDPPTNVLHLSARLDVLAKESGVDEVALRERVARVCDALYTARQKRDQPGTDDKIIAAWNGLMIGAIAEAALVLRDASLLDLASRAARAVLKELRGPGGALLRTSRRGSPGTPGTLEDAAAMIHGLLAIRRAATALGASDHGALDQATALLSHARATFQDRARAGWFFDSEPGREDLIVRTASTHDGAMPSARSLMLHNLIDFYEITGDESHLSAAADTLASLSPAIAESAVSAINATRGLFRLLRTDRSLVTARLGAAASPAGARTASPGENDPNWSPVQVFASEERVVVTSSPAELHLELRIDERFHITAHEPGVEGLVPLAVEVHGGTGVRASVEYPRGETYSGEALPAEEAGRMRVHRGVVQLVVSLERNDTPWSGRPMLLVTYQPCTDSECYQPITVELDVALDPS